MHASPSPISAAPSFVSWPHNELHRRPQWRWPHASPPFHFGTPLTRFLAPSGAPPTAPVGVFACLFPAQDIVSWPHSNLHRMRYSQPRCSPLHMVGPFARLISLFVSFLLPFSIICASSSVLPHRAPGPDQLLTGEVEARLYDFSHALACCVGVSAERAGRPADAWDYERVPRM